MFDSLKKCLLALPAGDLVYRIVFYLLPASLFCYFLYDVVVAISLVFVFGYIFIVLEGMVKATVIKRLGISERFSMPLFIVVLLSFVSVFSAFMFPVILEQSAHFMKELPANYLRLQSFLNQYLSEEVLSKNNNVFSLLGSDVFSYFTSFSKGLVNYFLSSIVNISSVLIYLVLIPLLTFFLVKDRAQFKAYAATFLSKPRLDLVSFYWSRVDLILTSYIRGKIVEVFVVGLASFGLFYFMGLKYSLMLSTLVGLSVLVPFVGAFLVTLPVALVAFAQWGVSADFFELILAYLVLQLLDGNVLVPYIFSEHMNLHPAAILLAVMVFGGLFGVAGVFFAIPMLAIGKLYLTLKSNLVH
ncbi:AI-2E family transporter [Pseudoalteromonas marina]|uniref:AI-2E family transporter n=2 Tax=Bacteria TaxID=2 RepID=A0ABT9FG94_9GAMM|nr:AI-2E family transporter [Pseudoalteromonas marina]MDP2565804.1 AI-2E family transporter [Pseudoalteromonas marina]